MPRIRKTPIAEEKVMKQQYFVDFVDLPPSCNYSTQIQDFARIFSRYAEGMREALSIHNLRSGQDDMDWRWNPNAKN